MEPVKEIETVEGLTVIKKKRGRPKGSKNAFKQGSKVKKPKSLTVTEKRNLIKGLKIHMPDEIDKLKKYVKGRTAAEIEEYLERQKLYIKLYHKCQTKAPIEQWSILASDLLVQEKNDYTENLARVMSIAANLEDHPVPDDMTPDYSAIYRCLSAVLQGSELPELGPLECGVVLDLLHGLVDTLRRHDTHEQRQIMIWKYMLLRGKVDTNDLDKDLSRCRKAIENDFSDFTGSKSISSVKNKAGDKRNETVPGSAEQAKGAEQSWTSSAKNQVNSESETTIQQKENQLKKVGLMPSPEKKPHCEDTATINSTPSTSHVDGSPDEQAGNQQEEKKMGQKGQNTVIDSYEEKVPKKPKMFTLNPFCIPVNQLKLKLKPHVRSQAQAIQNNQCKVTSLPKHFSSLSGIVPGKPGCSTHHTTVVTVESPFRGRQRAAMPKKSRTTEVVVVTPGNQATQGNAESLMQNIEAISLQEILKQNQQGVIEIVDSAENKFVVQNPNQSTKGVKTNKGHTEKSTSDLKEFIQGTINAEDVVNNLPAHKTKSRYELVEVTEECSQPRRQVVVGNQVHMEEEGVVIPTGEQQINLLQESEPQLIDFLVQRKRIRRFGYDIVPGGKKKKSVVFYFNEEKEAGLSAVETSSSQTQTKDSKDRLLSQKEKLLKSNKDTSSSYQKDIAKNGKKDTASSSQKEKPTKSNDDNSPSQNKTSTKNNMSKTGKTGKSSKNMSPSQTEKSTKGKQLKTKKKSS